LAIAEGNENIESRCPLCKQAMVTQADLPATAQDFPADPADELRLFKPAEVFTHKQYFDLLNETLKRRTRSSLSSLPDHPEIFEMEEELQEAENHNRQGFKSKQTQSENTLKLEERSFNNGYYAKFFREERKIGKGAYGR